MTEIQATIKLRIDVDYPYPSSRKKSFFYVALGIKNRKGKDYLRNARVIAKMINESPKKVKAYWFFTQYTIPDKKLLELLTPDRHDIGLHIVNDAEKELKSLEKEIGRTINFYTYHGTSNRFAQILWKRKLGQKQSSVPNNFQLQSFHEYTTTSLDTRIYQVGLDTVKEETKTWLKEGTVISIHPEWLFVTGEKNHRGRYYEALKYLLEVDHEFESVQVRKKFSVKIAKDNQEYEKNASPTQDFIEKIEERRVDIYTFLDRSWCCPITNPQSNWLRTEDNVGLLEITNFDDWFSSVGKKTRNMVRRAEKSGVKVKVVEFNGKLVEGIWKIYNETPIRQGRAFPHFGESLKSVGDNMAMAKKTTFIGAYLDEELVGFIQIVYGDQIAVISQILSLQKHWDKALNNALLAKAVEVCAANGNRWLMYGRIGNHPSLDTFKENNGFKKFPIARYYVALTSKGKFAMRLGLHRDLKDALPQWLKDPLIPVFSWVSRNKALLRLRLRNLQ